MLEIICYLLIIFCIVAWIVVIFFPFTIGDLFKNSLLIWLIIFFMSCVVTVVTWRIDVILAIQRNKAQIKAYQTYKSQYDFDKKIDTEIENKYIDAIRQLEYFKSIGLYDDGDIAIDEIKPLNENIFGENTSMVEDIANFTK